ncbi:hypothetical protein SETIT_2G040000v2 [Setaria italica]|uniref:Uncharacterized protein n=1 Tax=Setaria italica TaxID=4555 RepID=A0A368PVT9_SETIT|nr:hypothetical protein SETIT_2G040000v2 [Setaria italica]
MVFSTRSSSAPRLLPQADTGTSAALGASTDVQNSMTIIL